MPEVQAGRFVDADQLGAFGGSQVLETAPAGGGAAHHVQVAGGVQGCQEQQVAGGRGQAGDAGGERRLEPSAER
ncbi:hypothetical protein [Streptomyces nojiriensis]|uniref:hypothetical protein n=1 Tax=Streptomyces nojiriensis TaxID=66374 RepID=UPI0035E332CF